MREVEVCIVHDDPLIADYIAERLTNDDYIFDRRIARIPDLSRTLEAITNGLRPKTIIFHKGLGDRTPLEPFIDGIRKTEQGELIRLGIVSGEFYGGQVCQTALTLGANFGWDSSDTLRNIQHVPDWVVSMAWAGYLHPFEVELRGKEIILSELQARDRLKLLGVTSSLLS